jgi:hypothetical protein
MELTLEIFWITAFLVKHYLGDFVLQTKAMVDRKAIFLSAEGLTHAGIHGALSALVACFGLLLYGGAGTSAVSLILTVGVADFVIHYLIDVAKSRYVPASLTPETQLHWVFFGLDQLMHNLTYVGFIVFLLP